MTERPKSKAAGYACQVPPAPHVWPSTYLWPSKADLSSAAIPTTPAFAFFTIPNRFRPARFPYRIWAIFPNECVPADAFDHPYAPLLCCRLAFSCLPTDPGFGMLSRPAAGMGDCRKVRDHPRGCLTDSFTRRPCRWRSLQRNGGLGAQSLMCLVHVRLAWGLRLSHAASRSASALPMHCVCLRGGPYLCTNVAAAGSGSFECLAPLHTHQNAAMPLHIGIPGMAPHA